MGAYDEDVLMAQQMIAEAGASVEWRVMADASPAPGNPRWKPTNPDESAIVKHTVSIVFLPLTSGGSGLYDLLARLAGTEIQSSNGKPNLWGLMGAVSFTPSIKDVIRGYMDKDIRISSMKPIAPNGQIVLWDMKLIQ